MALDHDFSPSSATPSVKLLIDLPTGEERIDPGRWYAGHVFVAVKDATLQASTPLRHAAETLRALRQSSNPSPEVRLDADSLHTDLRIAFVMGLVLNGIQDKHVCISQHMQRSSFDRVCTLCRSSS